MKFSPTAKCKECGKRFTYLCNRAQYCYRIKEDMYCSWTCMRAVQKRAMQEKKKRAI